MRIGEIIKIGDRTPAPAWVPARGEPTPQKPEPRREPAKQPERVPA